MKSWLHNAARSKVSDESIIQRIAQCVLATVPSLMRPRLKNQCKSIVLCCSVQPDLTSLLAELRKSFSFMNVTVEKEYTLIMETSTN